MPPFLPITADNRSQNIRVGGKKVTPGKVTYVDFGNLLVPGSMGLTAVGEELKLNKELKLTVTKTGAGSTTLVKSKWFGYAVTALDAYGGETPPSAINVKETEAGTEGAGARNEIKVEWLAVPFATAYKVYRAGVGKTGLASEAVALETTPEFIAEVTAVKSATEPFVYEYNDAGQVETPKGKPPATNNTFYNTNKTAQKPFRDLQNHLAIGAILTVGPLTDNPGEWVPVSVKTWELKLESEKIKLEKGEIENRATGVVREVAEAKPTITKAAAGEEYVYLVVYNTLNGKVEALQGKKVAAGKASLTEATITEKLTAYMQPLFGLKQTGTETIPSVINEVLPIAGEPIVGLYNILRA